MHQNHRRTTAAILGFVALLGLGPAASAEQPPNVVLIVADDLGYRELGSFGQEKIKTPRLDELARQGMRLTQHYSGNAVCAPSRSVLMTGQHPGHTFVRDNRSTPPEGQQPLPPETFTIAKMFASAGYATGGFGKWGLGGPESGSEPLDQGFDRFVGYFCQAHAHSYYPSFLRDDRAKLALNNDPPVPGHASLADGADPTDPRSFDVFKGTDYAPDRINRQALRFIRDHEEEPFFLYYPTIIPHVALHVPDEALPPYLDLGWNDPPFVRAKGYGYTPHFTPRAAYAAMITRMDQYIGRILDLLDELQLSDQTIVVFSSDNGTTHLGEEVDYEFFASVGELRGLKGSLYEGGIRVPTIVRWPGKVPAGSVTDYISGFEDWMPTLHELAGLQSDLPEDIDGVSLAATLQGDAQPERDHLYREFPGYGGQQMIRVGRWKAIRQNLRRGNTEIELYDLETDPSESNNVAEAHPQVVERLAKQMKQQHVPSELFPLPTIDPK